MDKNLSPQTFDVAVVGGGPAGLQAALTLGRVHRRVLLLDSGEYRNAPAAHLHNFVTRDGTPPAEFRAQARRELAAYETVAVRATPVTAVEEAAHEESAGAGGFGWRLTLADGEAVHARAVILATGLRDELTPVPGLAESWGDLVAHCPFCHGHELAGRRLGLLGSGPHLSRVRGLVAPLATEVVVLTDGGELDPATHDAVAGTALLTQRLKEVRREGDELVVTFEDGSVERVGGLFVATQLTQSAPFAQQLGLDLLPSGCIEVDAFGRTSRPGVYAAGDAAHTSALPMPMASVLTAAAAGLVAASTVTAELIG